MPSSQALPFSERAAVFRRAAELPAGSWRDTVNAATVLGTADDAEGWFVAPTLVECTGATHEVFSTEYFGPILAVHPYDDGDFEAVVAQADTVSPYALTGSIFATDRSVVDWAQNALRFAAGNFYLNDKPTGAVVGQQPLAAAAPTTRRARSSICSAGSRRMLSKRPSGRR